MCRCLWRWLCPHYVVCIRPLPELLPSQSRGSPFSALLKPVLLPRKVLTHGSSGWWQCCTFSPPRPTPPVPVPYTTAFLPHALKMRVGENVLLLLGLGKINAQLLRKTIFSYSAAWEGLHEDVLGIYGSETHSLHIHCSFQPCGGHLK